MIVNLGDNGVANYGGWFRESDFDEGTLAQSEEEFLAKEFTDPALRTFGGDGGLYQAPTGMSGVGEPEAPATAPQWSPPLKLLMAVVAITLGWKYLVTPMTKG